MSGGVLEALGVVKSFRMEGGETPVLRGVDLSLNNGEMVALVGASGAGKTSLLNILGALDPDYEGSVVVGGNRLKSHSGRELAGASA